MTCEIIQPFFVAKQLAWHILSVKLCSDAHAPLVRSASVLIYHLRLHSSQLFLNCG